jgi:hypothetical protein
MAINIDDFTDGAKFNTRQWISILQSANELIDYRKQKLIHNKKSSMDEAFESLNTLLSTLNEKAKELDTKKLEKIIKKLNPKELVKAYEESNIGDTLRDKAINELNKENIELKKQNGARNVMADMKEVK